APWWLREDQAPSASPQVESIVLASLRMFDLSDWERGDAATRKQFIHQTLERATEALKDEVRASRKLLEQAGQELSDLAAGRRPLEPLFQDNLVSDIFIDRHENIRVIRRGHAIETPFRFYNAEAYRFFVTALLRAERRTLNDRCPIVDCVLDDKWHTRVNAVH